MRAEGADPASGDGGGGSVRLVQGRCDQETPPTQLLTEFSGQSIAGGLIGKPHPTETADQSKTAQHDGEADQQLQAEFQHGSDQPAAA